MLRAERRAVATHVDHLAAMTPGRTGNLSTRRDELMAITPTGVKYVDLAPEDVPVVTLDGDHLSGSLAPSSESPLHRAVYSALDVGAIAHVHSPWATTFAVLHEPIPPVHYALARAGPRVPVADYATYGTTALAANVVEAMQSADARACLLANHGLVATGDTVEATLETAEAVETTARVYWHARSVGDPAELSIEEIQRVAERFKSYGQES